MILEPDNSTAHWGTGTIVRNALVAAGDKLLANGFAPEFIAPSAMCLSNSITHYDQMAGVPRIANYLKEISYHRYCGVNIGNLQTIASRACNAGIATSMLEWWDPNNSYQVLHEDLKEG